MTISNELDALIVELLDCWYDHRENEGYAPDEYEIAEWFENIPRELLRDILRSHEDIGYRQVAAYVLVVRWDEDSLPEMRIARHSEDEWLREIADCGCRRFDPNVWMDDFWWALARYAEIRMVAELTKNLSKFWKALGRYAAKRLAMQHVSPYQLSLF